MSKKEDLWGRFSGRTSTSPRTGFLSQQNTNPPCTHTHHIPLHPRQHPDTHHTPHTPHTQYTHTTHTPHTHTLLLQPLSLTAGRTSETSPPCVSLVPSLTKKDQAPCSSLSTNPAASGPLQTLSQPHASPVNAWILFPCFYLL